MAIQDCIPFSSDARPKRGKRLSECSAVGAVSRGCRTVLMAVLPAMCEELAFRGFILSGLRHLGHKWWAIGLSAVFFGMATRVIQQIARGGDDRRGDRLHRRADGQPCAVHSVPR